MNAIEAIKSRKSVRSFTGQIDEAKLAEVLSTVQVAPVGMKRYEDVKVVVVRDAQLLEQIDRCGQELFGRQTPTLYGAPVLVIVAVKLTGQPMDNVAYSNAAGVVENMAIAAVETGLGACHIWGATMAMGSKPELLAKLNLPEGFVPTAGLVLGNTEEAYELRQPEQLIDVTYLG